MLALAVGALGLSALWTVFVVFANMMADAPRPLSRAWALWGCWLVTAGLFLWWALDDRVVI